MKYLLVLILSTLIFLNTQAQNPYAKTVRAQAEAMEKLFAKKDYKAYSKYTYPRVKELMGGEEKMIRSLSTSIANMERTGAFFQAVDVAEPSAVVTQGKELQCTMMQTMKMKVASGLLVGNSTLIGISSDGGRNWTFVDASNKDLTALRKDIPTLSAKLVIPHYPAPKVIPGK